MILIFQRFILWCRTQKALALTALILISAIIIPITWFDPYNVLLRGDPIFQFDPIRYFTDLWSLWPGKVNLGAGSNELSIAKLPYHFLQAVPAWLGGNDRTAEIVHFIIWFSLPGFTMALLIKELCDRLSIDRWAVPVAVTFYLFNLYRVAIFGDNNHFLAYAAIPFAMYCLTLVFNPEKQWLRPTLGLALSTLVITRAGTNAPMYLIFWLAVVLYGLVLTIATRKYWRRSLAIWATLAGTTLLLNIFWLVPFYLINLRQTTYASTGNLNWLSDLSKATSLDHVVRLMGAWDWFEGWHGEAYAPFAQKYLVQPWSTVALLPLFLVPTALFFKKAWNRYVLTFLILGVIGLIFSQGTHPPFGPFFEWCARNIPLFWIFRSPWYKFTNLTALSYSLMIGLGTGYLLSWLADKPYRKIGMLYVVAAICLPLIIAHPLIDGSRWVRKDEVHTLLPDSIPYPTHIRQAADWLNSQPGETGVALLPYIASEVYDWGFNSLVDPFVTMSRRPVFIRGDRIGYIVGDTPGASVVYRTFVTSLYRGEPEALSVARLLGMEYIVVRNDIRYNFYDDTDSPAFIKDKIQQQSAISLVKQFGAWDIYRIEGVKENTIYSSNWITSFYGSPIDSLSRIASETVPGNPFPALVYSNGVAQPFPSEVAIADKQLAERLPAPQLSVVKTGMNRYTVKGDTTAPFLLVLNQSYDSYWQARSQTAQLGQPIVVNGYAPAWLVQSNGPFEVQIEYKPQRLVVPLISVSLIIAFILLGFILYRPRRKQV